MQQIVIIGAGGLGQLTRDIVLQAGVCEAVAFIDRDPRRHGARVDGLPVVGGLDQINRLRWRGVTGAVVAIGINQARIQVAARIAASGLELVSAIHPLARFAGTARLGRHLIIGPRVNVCVHATLGDHVVALAGAIIEHDNVVGSGAFLHPATRLAGGVTVGPGAVVEIGACVIPGVNIGARARVAAGAIVIRDVPDGTRSHGATGRSAAFQSAGGSVIG